MTNQGLEIVMTRSKLRQRRFQEMLLGERQCMVREVSCAHGDEKVVQVYLKTSGEGDYALHGTLFRRIL